MLGRLVWGSAAIGRSAAGDGLALFLWGWRISLQRTAPSARPLWRPFTLVLAGGWVPPVQAITLGKEQSWMDRRSLVPLVRSTGDCWTRRNWRGRFQTALPSAVDLAHTTATDPWPVHPEGCAGPLPVTTPRQANGGDSAGLK